MNSAGFWRECDAEAVVDDCPVVAIRALDATVEEFLDVDTRAVDDIVSGALAGR